MNECIIMRELYYMKARDSLPSRSCRLFVLIVSDILEMTKGFSAYNA
jgi:hypothetical protein